MEPDAGLKFMNREIMTWTEINKHLTDWATQAPLSLSSHTWLFKLTYQDLHLVVSYQEIVFPRHWGRENPPEVDYYSVLDAAEVS